MAFQSALWNGVTYSIPGAIGDTGWSGATKVDGLLVSLAANAVNLTLSQTLKTKIFDSSCAIGDATDTTKQLQWSLSGATSATHTTFSFSQTVNRTITFQDATDTVVCRATTDTLTNKNLSDQTTFFVNAADTTKQCTFSLVSATTGTKTTFSLTQTVARTITFPDATDQIVCRATTDTLTNKTINGASNTLTVRLANDVSGTIQATNFPALTGDITTTAGSLATTAAATQANISTLSKSTGVAVHGTNTNDSASAGYIGEYIESLVSANTSLPGSTGNYADLTSISLSAGDWDVTGIAVIHANGATITELELGISTTSGNSATGLVQGSNRVNSSSIPTASADSYLVVPAYRMSLSSTTTVYLKNECQFSVATPQYTCRLSARRAPR